MAPPIERVLQLGFCFEPTPKQAVTYFLPHLIAGEPIACKRQPHKAGKSSRAVRPAGPGSSWHSHGHTTDVFDGAGVKIGDVKKFRYKKGGAFTDWLMDEHSIFLEGSVVGDRQYVLCKIYVSPGADPDSAAHQEFDAVLLASTLLAGCRT